MYPGEEKPNMTSLSQFLTEYCGQWRFIGYKLGLSDSLLSMIHSDNSTQERDCFRITLKKWLDQDPRPTWSTLELAITNARREANGLNPLQESKQCKEVGTWLYACMCVCVHCMCVVCVLSVCIVCVCVCILYVCVLYVSCVLSACIVCVYCACVCVECVLCVCCVCVCMYIHKYMCICMQCMCVHHTYHMGIQFRRA